MVVVDLFDHSRGFRIKYWGKGDHKGSVGGSHRKPSFELGLGQNTYESESVKENSREQKKHSLSGSEK